MNHSESRRRIGGSGGRWKASANETSKNNE
jgi:hypothetical protein